MSTEVPLDPVDRIMAVMEHAFEPLYGEAWNRRQVWSALVLGNCHFGLIAPDGSDCTNETTIPAGFYLSRTVLDEEELLLFAITPEHRKKGLGHALLKRMIESARSRGVKRIFLEMREGNPAGGLYESHGFRHIGTRPKYYRTSDGQRIDALSHELLI